MPRPKYDAKAATPQPDEGEEDHKEGREGDNEEDEEKSEESNNKLNRFKMKANHEATSDEDED